jgi:DNA (cytosine-5)-methyltransferase 1
MSKSELLEKCKELGITKCNSKNKSQLIELINSKQKILVNAIISTVNLYSGLGCPRASYQERDIHLSGLMPRIEVNVFDPTSRIQTEVTTSFLASSSDATVPIFTPTIHTFIELCAGGGGLSAGLMKSGFTPVLLNDNNNDCCKTLKHNHPDANVVCGSMDKIDYSPYVNKVDLLTGGVPCQSYSQSGLRKGLDDPRGDLMLKFADILHLVKPKIFMIENVKGLLSHNNGETIKTIIEALNTNNLYNIQYRCLDASKYDVPQKRERVFIVGVLHSITRSFEFPTESSIKTVLKDVLHDVPFSNGAKYNEEKIKLFRMIPQGGCWVNLPENLQKEYLGNSYNSGGGKRGILYRLSMEKPSLTLLCTPSQKQTERCHPLEERPLTVREYARIQTFADGYEFIGSMNSQYKQIGNAVPVELAKHMGDSLLKLLV